MSDGDDWELEHSGEGRAFEVDLTGKAEAEW